MNIASIEILKIVMFVIYFMSSYVYIKELIEDLKEERPKVFSEWFWYIVLVIGGFVPVLNTVVCYKIIKTHKEHGQ